MLSLLFVMMCNYQLMNTEVNYMTLVFLLVTPKCVRFRSFFEEKVDFFIASCAAYTPMIVYCCMPKVATLVSKIQRFKYTKIGCR